MTKDSLAIPITVSRNEAKYKLLYLQFNSDSSVYVIFPRKRKYRILKDNHSIKLEPGVSEIKLEDSSFNSVEENPYISFHPGKLSSHINTQQTRKRYLEDAPIVEMSDEANASIFPLCTLTFSDMSFLDTYKQRKEHKHELNFRENNSEKHLSLEIWLHSSDKTPLPEDFPQPEGVLNTVTLHDDRLGVYTATIRVRELEKSTVPADETELRGINVAAWRKGGASMFLMVPADDKTK